MMMNTIQTIAHHYQLQLARRHQALANHRHSSEQSRESCAIRLHEVRAYRRLFEMRIFQFTRLDLSFVLGAGLFALNYIVFLNQTN